MRGLWLGVRVDFGTLEVGGEDVVGEVERQLARFGVEKDLGDAVVRQALLLPSKAPGSSWPVDLLRAQLLVCRCVTISDAQETDNNYSSSSRYHDISPSKRPLFRLISIPS